MELLLADLTGSQPSLRGDSLSCAVACGVDRFCTAEYAVPSCLQLKSNSGCNGAAGQMTEGVTLAFALRRLRASVPLLAPFDKLQRKFLKQALSVFGSAENAPRVQAILFMRAMAVQLPPPMLDSVLKVSRVAEPGVVYINNCILPDSLLLTNTGYAALDCLSSATCFESRSWMACSMSLRGSADISVVWLQWPFKCHPAGE